jgi:hypothetical protein
VIEYLIVFAVIAVFAWARWELTPRDDRAVASMLA